MPLRLHIELEKLKQMILGLGTTVEDCLLMAIASVEEKNVELAQQVFQKDEEIDEKEVEVEEECLKILALHQPVATDLRFIVSVLKINNDLERVGDLAVNIAGRAEPIAALFPSIPSQFACPIDLALMSQKVRNMLRLSLDALCMMDPERALNVRLADREVDQMNRAMYKQLSAVIVENPQYTEYFLQYMSLSKYLERIADHATNIAEDVIYLCSGRIIRHRFFTPAGSGSIG